MKMTLLISFACLAECVFAQKSFFGVDAGMNIANQRMIFPVDYNAANPFIYTGNANSCLIWVHKNSLKPTFGFFYQYSFLEKISFRVSAQYMGLGYHENNFFIDNLDINYLTFPITFHYSVTKHLSINAGPYLSFTLGGTRINNEDITKTYHKNDFGFVVGAEHDIYKNLAFGTYYYVGTKNIWLNDLNGLIKYTNRALQFTLIYKFRKNKITL